MLAVFSLSRRSNDRRGEFLIFPHTVGQLDATDLTHAALVGTPCTAAEIAADNHLKRETLAQNTCRNHGIRSGQLPVGADVGGSIQKLGCNLIEHLSFVRDTLGKDHVKGRYTVGCDHDELAASDIVDVAYFAVVDTLLTRKMEVSLY